MKKFLILLILFPVISNAQFKNILKKSSETATGILNKNGKVDIAAGLKEALNKGITEQVSNPFLVYVMFCRLWLTLLASRF